MLRELIYRETCSFISWYGRKRGHAIMPFFHQFDIQKINLLGKWVWSCITPLGTQFAAVTLSATHFMNLRGRVQALWPSERDGSMLYLIDAPWWIHSISYISSPHFSLSASMIVFRLSRNLRHNQNLYRTNFFSWWIFAGKSQVVRSCWHVTIEENSCDLHAFIYWHS